MVNAEYPYCSGAAHHCGEAMLQFVKYFAVRGSGNVEEDVKVYVATCVMYSNFLSIVLYVLR